MIQDIFPYQLNNQYKDVKPAKDDFVMLIHNRDVLIQNTCEKDDDITHFPTVSQIGLDKAYIYLFSITKESDEEKFFMLADFSESLFEKYRNDDSYKVCGIRELPNQCKHYVYAAYTAKHLMDWYRDTKFCGRCGEKLHHDLKERAMKCDKCGNAIYPRIMPAVIVGVKNQDKLLLTKYQRGYQHNALIAGFTEIGETIEETVSREVMEEAGIKVKNITYYKSQPWGIANDILVGYYCEVDGDDTIHMDSEELKYAEWVKREDIILQPQEYSLTNEMMKMFKDGEQ